MTDISTWTIVMAAGKIFLGKCRGMAAGEGRDLLDPVFELQTMMQLVQGPRGEPTMAVRRQCSPVLTFSSISSLTLPDEGTVTVKVADLDKDEQRELENAVYGCEQLVLAMRAQRSGIVVAPNGAIDPKRSRG